MSGNCHVVWWVADRGRIMSAVEGPSPLGLYIGVRWWGAGGALRMRERVWRLLLCIRGFGAGVFLIMVEHTLELGQRMVDVLA